MTDIYGIGDMLRRELHQYRSHSRRTGRTARMLMQLKDGDTVITSHGKHADYLRHQVEKAGLRVTVLPAQPSLHDVGKYGPYSGRIHFDHTWVEDFFKEAVEGAAHALDRFTFEKPRMHSEDRECRDRMREFVL